MAMIPPTATKQEAKVRIGKDGKPHWYPSESWSKAESTLTAHLDRFKPKEPIRGPVMLEVLWCFPKDGKPDGTPYTKKPDTDNLDKGLKDIMTRLGWWVDDAQVFSELIVKVHSRVPGIRIDIHEPYGLDEQGGDEDDRA